MYNIFCKYAQREIYNELFEQKSQSSAYSAAVPACMKAHKTSVACQAFALQLTLRLLSFLYV